MAETKANATRETHSTGLTNSSPAPVVIDLGKQKRKRIKRMLKGGGRLYDDVQEAVEELKEVGKIKGDAQLVFVSVKKKRKKRNFAKCGLGLLG